MKKIFAKKSDKAFLTMDENKNPIFEERVSTFKVQSNKNGYVIHELFRKNRKPEQVKTIKKSKKYNSISSVINGLRSNDIKLRTKQITNISQDNKSKIIQTNYLANIRTKPQLMALVLINNPDKKNQTSQVIGFSYRMTTNKPNKSQLDNARKQAINSAKGQFIKDFNLHGIKYDNNRLEAQIIEERYIYFK